eukprot:scaffold163747_cov18-Tisochrysis_lutea.AAC.1
MPPCAAPPAQQQAFVAPAAALHSPSQQPFSKCENSAPKAAPNEQDLGHAACSTTKLGCQVASPPDSRASIYLPIDAMVCTHGETLLPKGLCKGSDIHWEQYGNSQGGLIYSRVGASLAGRVRSLQWTALHARYLQPALSGPRVHRGGAA